jgi:starch synthase
MPSEFEPCGLAQMIAMRYGTLPLVRETGGLKDTVWGYWDVGDDANGFSFRDFDPEGLRNAVDLALELWYDKPDTWAKLRSNALAMNYGWEESAQKYRELYSSLLG